VAWHRDNRRHSLAAQGVSTGHKADVSGSMNAKPKTDLEQATEKFVGGLFNKKSTENDQEEGQQLKGEPQLIVKDPNSITKQDMEQMQREFREAQEMKRKGLI